MLVSSKLNRLRALSINEVIERNYGATARVFGAVLTIIYTVALSVVQVVAMGSILAGILGIDTRLAMVYASASCCSPRSSSWRTTVSGASAA